MKIASVIEVQLGAFRDDINTRTEAIENQLRTIEWRPVDSVPGDEIKQNVNEVYCMDIEDITTKTDALNTPITEAQKQNKVLQNEFDNLEQYSRRNTLIFHGIQQTEKDTSEAGFENQTPTDWPKPLPRQTFRRKLRAIVIKLYGRRNEIFMAKRKPK